ncbi:MAG: hypothetical protein RLZZ292_3313 [Bacteroidota bacterium]|jgi:NADH:ubiquinone oxidoreductase subunit C
MSPNAKEKDVNKIIVEVKHLANNAHDFLQLCNGHDFMKICGLYFHVNPKRISSSFRLAYHITSFKQTNLYALSAAWAVENRRVLYR